LKKNVIRAFLHVYEIMHMSIHVYTATRQTVAGIKVTSFTDTKNLIS